MMWHIRMSPLSATRASTVSPFARPREARSASLDADATFGAVREPLLKVLHFMRSLEYAPRGGRQIDLHNLQDDIGEFPYESPSVFNFYQATTQQTARAARASSGVASDSRSDESRCRTTCRNGSRGSMQARRVTVASGCARSLRRRPAA